MGHHQERMRVTVHLSHEEATRYLVDYNFNRLSPEISSAVEEHVRTCPVCQRAGLAHAPKQRRAQLRMFRRLRPTRASLAVRLRPLRPFALDALLLAVLCAIGLSVYNRDPFYITRPLGLRALFPFPNALPTQSVPPHPTPSLLTATLRFETAGVQASAISVSPDGSLAVAGGTKSSTPVLVVYDTVSGKATATLTWPGDDVPGTLAWSSSSDAFAACDGATLAIWQMPSHTLQSTIPVSKQPGLRVYDVTSGQAVRTLDARTAFTAGTLLHWGADGQLSPAPAGAAGPSGVARPGNPLVGLWRVSGSRMFLLSGGRLVVGFDTADDAHGLLDWAPDERYILWGRASQPVTVPRADTTPNAGATDEGVAVPDVAVGTVARQLAQTGRGDVLLWFAPQGNALAICDRRAKGAALSVYSVDSDQVISVLPQACDTLSLSSFSWMPAGRAFLLTAPNHPITLYPITTTVG